MRVIMFYILCTQQIKTRYRTYGKFSVRKTLLDSGLYEKRNNPFCSLCIFENVSMFES